jgi:hypothetical protein
MANEVSAMSSRSRPAAARRTATAAGRHRRQVGIVTVCFIASACAAPPAASISPSLPATPSRSESQSAETAASSIAPVHVTTVIAGTGKIGRSGDGGPAAAAEIEYPVGITIHEGAVIFAEATANRVRQVGPNGVITTVAGTTEPGWSGDGGLATEARLASPTDVAFDPQGGLYVVDQDNQRLRRIDKNGTISTIAGTGQMDHSGDGGQSANAALDAPFGVVIDRDGDVLVTEEDDGVVRRIRANGVIDTIVGGGTASPGDGGPATDAKLRDLTGIAVDADGTILVADFLDCRVRSITPDGTIATVAGDGSCDHDGDEGRAVDAGLRYPIDVAIGPGNDLYILEHIDPDDGYVRRVDASGTIHAVPLDVGLREPMGLAVDGDHLYITNRDDERIITTELT